MKLDHIYKERIFSAWLAVIFGVFSIVLLALFFYQRLIGPVGSGTTSEWYFLGLGLFLLIIGGNFSTLNTRIDSEGILVTYGLFRHKTPWEQVEGSYQDKTSSVNYGGFGVRFNVVDGKSRVAYNTLGQPRIVIRQRNSIVREFAFSTRNPQEVIRLIEANRSHPVS